MSAGLYVIEYPHAVKIGHSGNLDQRLATHLQYGPTRYEVIEYDADKRGLRAAERRALVRSERACGLPVTGRTEWFSDLPYEHGVRFARDAVNDEIASHLDAATLRPPADPSPLDAWTLPHRPRRRRWRTSVITDAELAALPTREVVLS